MHRVPAGYPVVCAEKIPGTVGIGKSHTEHDGTNAGKKVVNIAGEITPAKRRIPVENLLKNLGAGACLELSGANLIEESAGR
jgi:hypothetical protein